VAGVPPIAPYATIVPWLLKDCATMKHVRVPQVTVTPDAIVMLCAMSGLVDMVALAEKVIEGALAVTV
jgi:hypothetical protein